MYYVFDYASAASPELSCTMVVLAPALELGIKVDLVTGPLGGALM